MLAAFSLSAANTASISPILEKLPLRFERNVGQGEHGIQFVARAPGYMLMLSRDALRLRLPGKMASPAIRFAGASANVSVEAVDRLPTLINDYTGPRNRWTTGAPCWSRVNYRNLYPGIDVVFYGQDNHIEYDAIVQAGADPSRVAFLFDAPLKPRLETSGDLWIPLGSGSMSWHKPVAYQLIGGQRNPVDASFVLKGNRVSLRVASYNHAYTLVIDPSLSFSTYLGGSRNDVARSIAIDPAGNILIAGATASFDLPVTNASFQPDYIGTASGGPSDAFLAKLNAAGSTLLYITYLGGADNDAANAIATDGSGNVYMAGLTSSQDFPVSAGALQTKFGGKGAGGNGFSFTDIGDAFVCKFDPTGHRDWCTYLGGSLDEGAASIALDSSGNIFVAGATLSSDFPGTSGHYQPHFGGAGGSPGIPATGYPGLDYGDGFIAKVDPTGTHLLAATYLGGNKDDMVIALALDPQGNVWAAGCTVSQNFPMAGSPLQKNFGGASADAVMKITKVGDGFLSELSPDLNSLVYSTYFGGSADDFITAMTIDSSGFIYIAGATQSTNFPTVNALYPKYAGPSTSPTNLPYMLGDAFVAKLKPGATGILFSTYLGGSDDDIASGIAVDREGNIDVVGMTNSTNFPVTPATAVQTKFGGSGPTSDSTPLTGLGDGFVVQLNSSGTQLLYSTYLGGSSADGLLGVAVDAGGNIYAVGASEAPDFPVKNALQGSLDHKNPQTSDAVVVKLSVSTAVPVIAGGGPVNGASFAPGGIVPGEIATIFGSNLTSSSGINLTSSLPLVREFLNVSVTVGGTAAPLFAVDNVNGQEQINFQVPWEVASQSTASVVVTNNGVASQPVSVPVLAAQPAIFAYNAGGSSFGAILHANFQLADTGHPAVPSETVLIYCTGLGAVSPQALDGAAAKGETTAVAPKVSVGGVAATVSFSGLAPGFVGLYQVNVRVPASLKSGNQAVVITINGVSSKSVLLPVQ